MTTGDAAFYGAVSFLAGTVAATLEINIYASILILAVVLSAAAFFSAKSKSASGGRKLRNVAVRDISSIGSLGRNKNNFFISSSLPIVSISNIFLISFLFLFGTFYYHLYRNIEESGRNIVFNAPISFSGIVSAEPHQSEKFQNVELKLVPPSVRLAASGPPLAGDILLLVPLFPELQYGDVVKGKGVIEPPSEKTGKPISFFPNIEILERHRGFWPKEKLIDFKKLLVGQFEKFLPSQNAAFLGGLTFGWRGNFTQALKQQMSFSGTTHLVALSGYNITILVLAVAAVFGYFFSRRTTFYSTGIIIFLFVLMVGAEASVLRAAIMGFLALLAKELGRLYSIRNAVVLTAAAMIFINPHSLSGIGFLLSFLSLLGIVYLEPAFKKFFRIENTAKNDFLSWQENGITTLSAQLAVAPLLIQNFGQFSLTSIAANILILEFVPLTMFFGFLLAAAGLLSHYLGFLIALPVNILLQYELSIIKLFSYIRLPVTADFNSWILLAAYYGGLIIFAKYYDERKDKKV